MKKTNGRRQIDSPDPIVAAQEVVIMVHEQRLGEAMIRERLDH
ncbi:MAG: hypothetical protein QOG64_1588 [Acidimicrobiaceae bacterium]|nr:hypothetical protein [Acidimicrobiaceae bacterium]